MLALTALFAVAVLLLALRPAPELRLQQETQRAAPKAEKIDLNTADKAALESLPGIGPELAERIIADRAANGPYHSAADLVRIDGIAEKTVSRLAELVTVSESKEDTP